MLSSSSSASSGSPNPDVIPAHWTGWEAADADADVKKSQTATVPADAAQETGDAAAAAAAASVQKKEALGEPMATQVAQRKREYVLGQKRKASGSYNAMARGARVIVVTAKGKYHSTVAEGKQVALKAKGKRQRNMADLGVCVGHPFGSVFDVGQGGDLSRKRPEESDLNTLNASNIATDFQGAANNSELFITAEGNQTLTAEDIDELRRQKKTSAEIIQSLTENSASFEGKTAFSKEKYIKKKKLKHTTELKMLRPTVLGVADNVYEKNPRAVQYMRSDTVARMLSLSNVQAYSRTLVVDGVQGLVAAGVLERQGGMGWVLCGSETPAPAHLDATRKVAVDRQQDGNLLHFPLEMLFKGEVPDPEQELVAFGPEEQQWWTTTGLRKKKAASVLQLKVDSLLVASKADPVSITKLVFPYLCDSGCFAIFGPSLDVLKELYVWLRDANNAVNLEISETYLQHHQVLPLRTHPMMSGTANSGYVLSGIKVASL